MARSNRAFAPVLGALLVGAGCMPGFPDTDANLAISRGTLRDACDAGRLEVCEVVGTRAAKDGDFAEAARAFALACDAPGDGDLRYTACGHLFGLAKDGHVDPAQRMTALNHACVGGVAQACSAAVADVAKEYAHANSPGQRTALGEMGLVLLVHGCSAGDQAQCTLLARNYEAGSAVLKRDWGRASALYSGACGTGHLANACAGQAGIEKAIADSLPPVSALPGERQDAALQHYVNCLQIDSPLRGACAAKHNERLYAWANRYMAGDGVARDNVEAAALMRFCDSDPCQSDFKRLVNTDPKVSDWLKARLAEEEAERQRAAEEARRLEAEREAEDEAQAAQDAAEEEERREQAAADRREREENEEREDAQRAANMQMFVQSMGAMQQSQQQMRENIGRIVQQSDARAADQRRASAQAAQAAADRASAQAEQAREQQERQQAQLEEQRRQQEAAMKAANLKKCLDEDQSCTYGSSNRCAPATAYGDHWAERRQYETAQTTLKLCANGQTMSRECGKKIVAATPSPAQQQAINQRIRDLQKRTSDLPSQYGCSWDTAISYDGSTVDFWCRWDPQFSSCMDTLVGNFAALEAARKLDECVYHGTFQYTRDQLRAKHDADCHKQWD